MINIGISLFNWKIPNSIWSNGGVQNTYFLVKSFEGQPEVENVFLFNAGDALSEENRVFWRENFDMEVYEFNDVKDKINVIIEAHAFLAADQVDYIKIRGGIAIAYKFGNELVMNEENLCKQKDIANMTALANYDAVWTHQHHIKTCQKFWEFLYKCPVETVPHVWGPCFIQKNAQFVKSVNDKWRFGYTNSKSGAGPKWRLACFEPNINIVKTSLVPIMIMESAYAAAP